MQGENNMHESARFGSNTHLVRSQRAHADSANGLIAVQQLQLGSTD
jgi:hypothetical protein